MKTLVLWSGAVVPSYHGFFFQLSNYCGIKILAPRKWKHGSVTFSKKLSREETDPENQNLNCEIISTKYLFSNSSHYLVPGLFMYLWKYKPDLLYIMDEMDRVNFLIHSVITKLFFPKTKIIAFSLQNIERPSYYRFYHRIALKLNSLLVSGCIAATMEAEKVLRRHGFKKSTTVIPLWASEAYFYRNCDLRVNLVRNELKISPTEIVIVFCGSMVKEKGIELLKKAIIKTPNIRLLSAGNGPLTPRVNPEKPIPQWVHLGPLMGKELTEFYQAGNYVILPSITQSYWKEQVGRSLIEGILCGCVALGSDSGSIPSLTLFPETTFKQGSIDSLIELLQSLPIHNQKQIYLTQLQNVSSQYTDKTVAYNTFKFFDTL